MRNIWVFVVAALALGAVAWFLLGDNASGTGLGGGDEEAGLTDAQLLEGDVGGSLAGAGGEVVAAAGTIEATPETTSDPMALGGFIVRGRTVDETRRPIRATIAARFTGHEPVVVETNADGTFEVALGERPNVQSGSVFAQADGDLAALGMFWMGMRPDINEADVGVVVMRKGQPLDVRVLHGGDPVAGARVALMGAGRWGRQMLFLQGVADDNGALHVPLAPAGALTVLAAGGAETGRGRATVTLPQKAVKPIEVELTDERTLDVVVVDKHTGDPIPGAVVRVGDSRSGPTFGVGYLPELPPAITDAEGHTQLRGLQSEPKEALRIAVEADGYPQPTSSWGPGSRVNTAHAKFDAQEVRIEMLQNRSLVFPIEGDLSPPNGTQLTIKRQNMYGGTVAPEGMSAVVKSGEVLVEGLPPGHTAGTLSSAEGLIANYAASAKATEGTPITFTQGRVLTVRVLEADGQPLVGKPVLLRAGSGNSNQGIGPAVTDEQGECTLPPTDLTQATILLSADANGGWWNAIPIGSIDLSTHTGIKVITLPARAPLVFAVKLDGRAALPPQFYLTIAGQYVQPTLIREDPSTGQLTIDQILADSDEPVPVQFWAEGFLTFNEKIERSALRAPIPVELKRSGTIVVRYAPPEDGRVQLAAQIWNVEKETWGRANSQTLNRPQAPTEDNTRRFEGMQAGRYRIRESQSGATSDPFDVVLGAPTEIQMDLSALTHVEGRVALPSGFKPRQARIARSDGGRSSGVKPDGSFKLRALRGDPMTLTVSHPLLMPDIVGGVKTSGGATGVVLKLKTGADLVFHIEGIDAKGGGSGPPAPVSVSGENMFGGNMRQVGVTFRLFEGSTTEGEPVRTGSPIFVDGALRIGGLAPGTYSLWLFRAGHVPKILRSIEVTKGPKDLGTLQMSKGSSLLVTLVAADGKPLGSAWARATFSGTPKYTCSGHASGKPDLKIVGLGAGTFQVTIQSHRLTVGARENKKVFDEAVQMDGSNDVSITVTVD